MIKVGVIGLGAMGQHHVRIYKELGCEVIGVVDASYERAREIGLKYDVPYYTGYDSLLAQGIEAASIAVPTSMPGGKTHCLHRGRSREHDRSCCHQSGKTDGWAYRTFQSGGPEIKTAYTRRGSR